jgi:hypothetical protein
MIECPECGQSFDTPNRAGLVPLHHPGGERCDGSLKTPVEAAADPDELTRRVEVRFTEAEWAGLTEWARERDRSLPTVIRDAVLAAWETKDPLAPPSVAAETPAVAVEGSGGPEPAESLSAALSGSPDVPAEHACPGEAETAPEDER